MDKADISNQALVALIKDLQQTVCAQKLIQGTEAHCVIKLNERTIIKMVGCKIHGLSEGNEP